ncbi:MAG: FAD-dependent monooxygenase, partial [Candidatus Thermoplasmatota archaeon]|nr:FAD-dependent monooxygenase [Candidatus Thermoplasmatota archaeon]
MEDVIVVGCGPAGATAGRLLSKAGYDVSIIEASRFPRDKACGGALVEAFFRDNPEMEKVVADIPHGTCREFKIYNPGWDKSLFFKRERIMRMIRRLDFDAALSKMAVDAGAKLMEGDAVKK